MWPVTILPMLLRLLSTLIFTLIFHGFALADPVVPVPASRGATLADVESRLAEEKADARAIDEKVRGLEKDLTSSRETLVLATRRVMTAEKRLRDVETRIDSLETERDSIELRLEKDRESLAGLALALARLRRVPPEAMMLQPGAPVDAARGAMLMRGVLPPLQERARVLDTDLKRLGELRSDMEREREKARGESRALEIQRAEMSALLAERESLYKKTLRERDDRKENLARISAQAKSLQDLISRIERENRRKDREVKAAALLSRRAEPVMPRGGDAILPVSGVLSTRYGERDALGAQSEGLSIDGMAGGVVVAPMGGVVRYAGPFRRFGNIVIVEHEKGYHSLIAGLGKIDTVEGRGVSAGEPVGALPGPDKSGRPTLYYELRQNGKPVDPSRKFPDLG